MEKKMANAVGARRHARIAPMASGERRHASREPASAATPASVAVRSAALALAAAVALAGLFACGAARTADTGGTESERGTTSEALNENREPTTAANQGETAPADSEQTGADGREQTTTEAAADPIATTAEEDKESDAAMLTDEGDGGNGMGRDGEQAYPLVTIELANGGIVTAELYPEEAPNTVNNFIALANDGFYDGVIFHRVIPGFMVQGGCPDGTGLGGPGYFIKGEFANNDFPNSLPHTRGVLSMARRGNPYDPPSAYDTAGSQFFIMVAESPHLDYDYAAFGAVTSGMELVDDIVSTPTDANDKPLSDQRIKSIRVDTRGVSYPPPEVLAE